MDNNESIRLTQPFPSCHRFGTTQHRGRPTQPILAAFEKKDGYKPVSAVLSLRGTNLGAAALTKAGPSRYQYEGPFSDIEPRNSSSPHGGFIMLKVHGKKLETVTVLSLRGQIVTGETDILHDIVQSLSGTSALILDLGRVSKIDAHGLGVMLELREQAQANGIRFELMNISKPLSGILELTHLDSVFTVTSGVGFFPSVSPERQEPMARLKSCA